MNKVCKVENCKSRTAADKKKRKIQGKLPVTFFPVPQTNRLFDKWKDVFSYLEKGDFICEYHFLAADIKKADSFILKDGMVELIPRSKLTLKKTACPVIETDENRHLFDPESYTKEEIEMVSNWSTCVVKNCDSKSHEIRFHYFPMEEKRFHEWILAIGRPDLQFSERRKYRICDKHFTDDKKLPSLVKRSGLKQSANPVLSSPTTSQVMETNLAGKMSNNDGLVKIMLHDQDDLVDDKNTSAGDKDPLHIDPLDVPNIETSNNDKNTLNLNSNNAPLIKILKPVPAPQNKNLKLLPVKENFIFVPLPTKKDDDLIKKEPLPMPATSKSHFLRSTSGESKNKQLFVPLQKLPISNEKERISLNNVNVEKRTFNLQKKMKQYVPRFVIQNKPTTNVSSTMKNGNPVYMNRFSKFVKEAVCQTENSIRRATKGVQVNDECEPIELNEDELFLASTMRKAELKQACRICFRNQNELLNVFQFEFEDQKLVDIIFSLSNHRLRPVREPRLICQSCADELIIAYSFQMKLKRASFIVDNIMKKDEDADRLSKVEKIKIEIIGDLSEQLEADIMELPCDDHNYLSNNVTEQKKSFQCQICDYSSAKTLTGLGKHYESQHAVQISYNMETVECLSCQMDVNTSDLRTHFDSEEHKNNINVCPMCFELLPTRRALTRHLSRDHEIPGGQIKQLNSDYPCVKCKLKFPTFKEIDDHFDKFHSSSLSCIICGRFYNRLMKFHMLTHLPNGLMLACRMCRISFNSHEELKEHENSIPHNKCHICGCDFETKKALKTHLRTHNDQPFVCELCGRMFVNDNNLRRHLELHNSTGCYCDKCPKKFPNPIRLMNHRYLQHELVCSICEAVLPSKWRLILHEARHKVPNAVICPAPNCHKTYPDQNELKEHLNESHEAFSCEICNKKFYASSIYRGHMSIHKWETTPEPDDPCQCKLCWKRFGTEKAKRSHIVHMHKINFCLYCPQLFASKLKLKTHKMQEHSNEEKEIQKIRCRNSSRKRIKKGEKKENKTFSCNICKKTLYTSSGFSKHKKRHAGIKPYACKYCNKRFLNNCNKEMHERTHTNDRRFPCSVCGKLFIQSGERNQHEKLYCKGVKKISTSTTKRMRTDHDYEDHVDDGKHIKTINENDSFDDKEDIKDTTNLNAGSMDDFFQKQAIESILSDDIKSSSSFY